MHGLVDIHCHLLPHVDDGADCMNTALNLLLMEEMDGVTDVIVTPHHRMGMFETPSEKIAVSYEKLKTEAKKHEISVRLHMGCEYHASSVMKDDFLLHKWPTLAGSSYVLAEFSGAERYSVIRQRIDELETAGFIPIIAHAERIDSLLSEPDRFFELSDSGAKIQITSGTLLGQDGWRNGRICAKLVKDGCVHFIATDAHNLKERMPDLGDCAEFLIKKYGAEAARKLLVTNPRKILQRKFKDA